jgi:fumarate hydratase, class I
MNLKMVKLASARYLDTLPEAGKPYGQAFRDRIWSSRYCI